MIKSMYYKVMIVCLSSSIVSMIGSMIDTALIGNFYSANALSSMGIIGPVMTIMSVLSGVICSGTSTCCSRSIGANKSDKANGQITTSVIFSTFFTIIFTIVLFVFAGPLIHLLGVEDESSDIFKYAKDYIYGVGFGFPCIALSSTFNYLLQINGKGRFVVFSLSLFVGLSVVFDLINIFIVKADMLGMGVATSASYYCYVIVMAIAYFSTKPAIKIKPKLFNIKYVPEFVANGLTRAIYGVSTTVVMLIVNKLLIAYEGPESIACVTVILSLGPLMGCFSGGIGQATDMISSIMFGERNKQGLKDVVKTFTKMSITYDGIITIIVMVFSFLFVRIYMSDTEPIFDLTVLALRLYCIGLIAETITSCFINFYLGTKNQIMSYVFSLCSNLLFPLTFMFTTISFLGVFAVVLAFPFGSIMTILLVVCICCLRKHSSPFNTETYLFLSKDFVIDDKNILEHKLSNKEEVMSLSTNISEFLKLHNTNLKTRMAISLIIEELGINVCDHGMKKKNKAYQYSIRIVKDGDSWIVRMRDNCEEFNPTEYIKMNKAANDSSNKDNLAKCIGLKLALNMATSADYRNILGFNNLILTLK